MATVIERQPKTESSPGELRFLLTGVSWETYCTMLADPGFAHVRLTYDHGALELMSPSRAHEKYRHCLGRLLEAAAEALDVPVDGGGSTTHRRELLKKGLEPDECYYVANEPLMRGKDDLDLEVDPPPDLVIEVELTISLVNKVGIYAALGVPELWRFDGTELTVQVLGNDGQYSRQETSLSFPQLPVQKLVEWMSRRGEMSETALIREFRQWVRDNLSDDSSASND